VSVGACLHDCVAQGAFRFGPREDSVADGAQRGRVAKIVGLRLFEAGGELIGVVEDLLRGTWRGIT